MFVRLRHKDERVMIPGAIFRLKLGSDADG